MKIYKIETGRVRVKKNQLQLSKGLSPKLMRIFLDSEWSDWLPIHAWAIEHAEGITLVDTGDTYKTSVKGYLPKWHPYYALAVDFDIEPSDEIGPQLLSLGIDPKKDIRNVILTHLHTDHAGGIYHFPNAEIIINRKEYKAASGFSGILAGYLPHRWPKWLNPRLIDLPDESFGPFSKSKSITSDGKIRIVSTPGHVEDHMSVIVEIDDLFYFLAGDTSYTEANMLLGKPDGIGTKESINTLRRIREFATQYPTIYLPSHDPEVEKRMDERIIVPLFNKQKDGLMMVD